MTHSRNTRYISIQSVSVVTGAEIKKYTTLSTNVIDTFCRNTWYTSGVIDEETLKMRWEGDGMDIEPGMQYWLNNDHKDKSGDHIVYTYGGKCCYSYHIVCIYGGKC